MSKLFVILALFVAAINGDQPVNIPCVTWIPSTYQQPTPDPSTLFEAAYTWCVTVQGDPSQCVGQGYIFPCFASDVNAWGHHDYVPGEFDTDWCRVNMNGTVKYSKQFYLPQKGPQYQTWTWQQVQTGSKIPDNAIRYENAIMARNNANAPGTCIGKGFTGWSIGQPDGTFGRVFFSVAKEAVVMDSFEVAVCTAYKPTPAPPTPAPLTPAPPTAAPTLPPNNKPYIRFGNVVPSNNSVDAVITQGSTTYTWSQVAFGQFSGWVEVFAEGTGTIQIYENNGARGALLLTTTIPLTPGPLVVVTKDYWPPAHPYNIETIAASYTPNPFSSGVRLFNLSPDTKDAGMLASGKVILNDIAYTLGSDWVVIPQGSETFTVVDSVSNKTLAADTTAPPNAPFVFTNFLIGLQSANNGSAYATQVVPLIDAPES